MPPSDQEPRYQLVDSNGNVVGSLFGDGSGNVVIADETDTQTTFGPDGITTPALEAEDLNTERYAKDGPDIQTQIDAVGDGGTVKLKPEKSPYTVSSEIQGDFNITLDFNGAKVIPSGDHNVLFVDRGMNVKNLWVDTSSVAGYSSSAVRLHTGTAGSPYKGDDGSVVTVKGLIEGTNKQGTGLELDCSGAGNNSITNGNRFELVISSFETGIKKVGFGQANSNHFDVEIIDCNISIDQVDGIFKSVFRGYIQPERDETTNSQSAIRNQTTNAGPVLLMRVSDLSFFSGIPVVGPNIRIVQYGIESFKNHTDNSAGVYSIHHDITGTGSALWEMIHHESGDVYRRKMSGNGVVDFFVNSTKAFSIDSNGDASLPNSPSIGDGSSTVILDGDDVFIREQGSNKVRFKAGESEFFDDLSFSENGIGPILISPNGSQYRVDVADDGTLSTTSV